MKKIDTMMEACMDAGCSAEQCTHMMMDGCEGMSAAECHKMMQDCKGMEGKECCKMMGDEKGGDCCDKMKGGAAGECDHHHMGADSAMVDTAAVK